jgi:hypothetical protein
MLYALRNSIRVHPWMWLFIAGETICIAVMLQDILAGPVYAEVITAYVHKRPVAPWKIEVAGLWLGTHTMPGYKIAYSLGVGTGAAMMIFAVFRGALKVFRRL